MSVDLWLVTAEPTFDMEGHYKIRRGQRQTIYAKPLPFERALRIVQMVNEPDSQGRLHSYWKDARMERVQTPVSV